MGHGLIYVFSHNKKPPPAPRNKSTHPGGGGALVY